MVETADRGRSASRGGAGRRVLVGTNVVVAVALVLGIVALCQWFAFRGSLRWDMTSSGVNSLSEATERLLGGLEKNVRLTSLYFETDLEDEDQPRYRRAMGDLLELYASTNRTKVTTEWINPLRDHDKLKALIARLRDLPAYKEQLEAYSERIEKYKNDVDGQMRLLIQEELQGLASAAGPMEDQSVQKVSAPIESLFTRWSGELESTRDRVDALSPPDNPQFAAVVGELRNVYRDFKKSLDDVIRYAQAELAQDPAMPQGQAAFLREAGARYESMLATVEEESSELQALKPLKIDDLLRGLAPNANPLLVETPDEVRVVDFGAVWPPLNDDLAGRRVRFQDRAFKGEAKLTSAILRATHTEQTAVVFVRYAGPPLFFGGFMPGQPPAPFATMKQQLEDANFVVAEWDLKTQDVQPDIDPEPTRTIYVVLKPTPTPRRPTGQRGPEPPFTDSHKRNVLDALADSGRSLFIAGWSPGPFGPIPATYEYNDHLKDVWGIHVDTSVMLIRTFSVGPGQYGTDRYKPFHIMQELHVTDHDIVHGAQAQLLALPWCAPLERSEPPPEGVEHIPLVYHPKRNGIWGIKSLQAYQEQLLERPFLTKVDGDLEGPFDLAIAAQKGDRKVVVVSSRGFALDQVAFATQMGITPQGLTIRSRNPGNVTLLINSLHWLNDNTEFVNIGKPIDTGLLEIEKVSTVRTVQALTMFVWPAMALVCGGVAWWVRRR